MSRIEFVERMQPCSDEVIDALVEVQIAESRLAARKAELLEQARQWSVLTESAVVLPPGRDASSRVDNASRAQELAHRALVAELSCALRIPARTVEAMVSNSRVLVNELQATLDALRLGEISPQHAGAIVDETTGLSPEAKRELEKRVLSLAPRLTAAKTRRKTRVLRERLHPETIRERSVAAADERRIEFEPAHDGMAWLHHFLPVATAVAIRARLTAAAEHLGSSAGETRTRSQLRSDIAGDLLTGRLDDGGSLGAVRPTVAITVPALSLLGRDDEPALLEGYGPIDIETARQLAAEAPSFTRILTHPETGAVLSVGRDRYSVPADLKRWLELRDGTCRFPGCGRPAKHCDLDHTEAWGNGGETSAENLAHLCRPHHTMKHETAWQVTQAGGGVLEWTAPSGRTFTSEPANALAPPGVETSPPF